MNCNELGLKFGISLSNQNHKKIFNTRVKSSIPHTIFKNILCSFLIISFFGINNCVQINIVFNNLDHSCDLTSNQCNTDYFHNPNNRKRMRNTETTFYEQNDGLFQSNTNQYIEYDYLKDYNIQNKRPRLNADIETETSTNTRLNYSHPDFNFRHERDFYQNNTEIPRFIMTNEKGKNMSNLAFTHISSFQNIMTCIVIDYSKTFIIKSTCFDIIYKSELFRTNINIKDITKSNIDFFWVKKCIDILQYGLHSQILGLKNKEFINLIEFLNDLKCYSETDALYNLYKRLLPSLYLYIVDESCFNLLCMTNSDYLRHIKLFLPFLAVLYDKVDIFFNSRTKELNFITKKQTRKSFYFDINCTDNTIIRTTPEALIYMEKDNSNEKKELFGFLVRSYKITGIKISSDDKYYTESMDTDSVCKFILNNPTIYKMQTGFCSIFENVKSMKINLLKSIEIERINLLSNDVDIFSKFENLESLILVKCDFKESVDFLHQLPLKFPKLRILRIVGFLLRNSFLNALFSTYIEILDLSCCKCVEYISKFTDKQMKGLKSLRIDYSSLRLRIIKVMILPKTLEILSMRGMICKKFPILKEYRNWEKSFNYLDLSRCKFDKIFLDFFSTNVKTEILLLENLDLSSDLKQILNQESLYSSTKTLSLSFNSLDDDIFRSLKNFEVLECLKLSKSAITLSNYFIDNLMSRSHIIALDLSENKLTKKHIRLLNQFTSLEEINLSNCNLIGRFMKYFSANNLVSLKKINLSGNNLSISDISRLKKLVNLKYLLVCFQSEVFSRFLEKHGALCFKNLETLVLVSTDVTSEIYQFIMTQSSLTNLELRGCKLRENVLTNYGIFYPSFLKSITLIDSTYSSEDMNTLEDHKMCGINVLIY